MSRGGISSKPARRNDPSQTPAMRQYAARKKQAGDAVLLFRMGDFYETFYDDAKLISRVLGIALTSRHKGPDAIPLAGIPYHALDQYLTKLVRAGHKVAVCDQVEDAKQAKGVVRREIVRVVTAGTLTDEALLDERRDNVLAALCDGDGGYGLATIELAGGRFTVFEIAGEELLDELVRLNPAELLVPGERVSGRATSGGARGMAVQLRSVCGTTISHRPEFAFAAHHAEQALLEQFRVATLRGFGFEGMDASLRAAGAIVDYLKETQRTALGHVTRLGRHVSGAGVRIDQNSWRSLEIERTLRSGRVEGSLLQAIDRTIHPMGSRLLRRWLAAPLVDAGAIVARQDAVAAMLEGESARCTIRTALKRMSDVERIAARVALQRATPRDLLGLGTALSTVPDLRRCLTDTGPTFLRQIHDALSGTEETADLLQRALSPDAGAHARDGGIIADGYDAELDRLRNIRRDGQQWLAAFQRRQIEATGINSLKVAYNKVFGYYIEVSHIHRERVPDDYVRKQTVKNAERYITDELKRFESEVLTAEEKAVAAEQRLFDELCATLGEQLDLLQRVADGTAQLDVVCGLAELAVQRAYVRPEMVGGNVLEVRDGRHPVLDQTLADGFVPNDCALDESARRVLVITGPNMAGKSTYIRQVALLTLLAQTGSYVPATRMVLGPVDRIFARVGASDEITRGQSTFMVEMTEAANILNNATDRSLVVLDEIGRGTSTFDGLSLAWAITEDLANRVKCRTLVATHYHELTELASLLNGVQNCNVAVAEQPGDGGIAFLHKIVPGGTDKSYGVHVARLAGVPDGVVRRSGEILEELQQGFARESHTGRLTRRRTKKNTQLDLFEDPAAAIARELNALDPDAMTPLDALQKLKGLRDRLGT